MKHSIHPPPTLRPRRALLSAAALLSGALIAGCGGSSPGSTVASLGSTNGSASSASSSHGGQSAGGSGPLAFARCMRANGVPNFPDPQPGGGALFAVPAGTSPNAPAFRSAHAKCQRFLGGGPPGPGSTTHPSDQTLVKLRRIAQCMRAHGISQFPDPRTSVPSNPFDGGMGEITDFDGAILLFPASFNLEAPAYRQALAACGAPPLGLHH